MIYNIQASDKGKVLNVDSSNDPVFVFLPLPESGFSVTIKDIAGMSNVNAITVGRNGSELLPEKIDGAEFNDVISTSFAAVTYIADGSNWFRMGSFVGDVFIAPIALFGGGYTGAYQNVIDYVTITTLGNASDFGDLTQTVGFHAAASSSTRGLWAGGFTGGTTNVIDYVTIATTGNAVDFGDLTVARYALSGSSNKTRAVFAGGDVSQTTIDYVEIATAGNAVDFGDLAANRDYLAATASPTRGVYSGPLSAGGAGTIEYITFSTLSNSASFGNQSVARYGGTTGISSGTRGVFAGGYVTGVQASNIIDYITIATLGDSTDFGDLTQFRQEPAGASSKTRGLTAGGSSNGPVHYNIIDYITIATLGNATDFGDLSSARQAPAGCSSVHGGL